MSKALSKPGPQLRIAKNKIKTDDFVICAQKAINEFKSPGVGNKYLPKVLLDVLHNIIYDKIKEKMCDNET